jgi:hypothetical protein
MNNIDQNQIKELFYEVAGILSGYAEANRKFVSEGNSWQYKKVTNGYGSHPVGKQALNLIRQRNAYIDSAFDKAGWTGASGAWKFIMYIPSVYTLLTKVVSAMSTEPHLLDAAVRGAGDDRFCREPLFQRATRSAGMGAREQHNCYVVLKGLVLNTPLNQIADNIWFPQPHEAGGSNCTDLVPVD